jgi:hypothetical protein
MARKRLAKGCGLPWGPLALKEAGRFVLTRGLLPGLQEFEGLFDDEGQYWKKPWKMELASSSPSCFLFRLSTRECSSLARRGCGY